MIIPDAVDTTGESLAAIEAAATACGRLSATVDSSPRAASRILLVRHSSRAFALQQDALPELLAGEVGSGDSAAPPESSEPDLCAVVDAAGLGAALSDRMRRALAAVESRGDADPVQARGHRSSSVLRAAVAAGTICAGSPASSEAQRAAALVGAVVLEHGGALGAPWVAPWELDAATRAAAVQVDRSGDWTAWVRSWCLLLAREAAAAESALRRATSRMALERGDVAGQHRVGATDAAVLAWLHDHVTFTIRDAATALGLTRPTVGTSIERLNAAGLATELTGQLRDRKWTATAWMELITTR